MLILQSANKSALRKAITATLRDLSQSEIQSQSQAITDKVLSLPAFQQCKTISCYLGMPVAEVQTTSLILNILADSTKTLLVPYITSSDGCMDFVRVYSEQDYRTFPSGLWGIPEPTPLWLGKKRQSVFDQDCRNLDLIIVPGLAFDQSLSRLGHGKGYYDRFISLYSTSAGRPKPLLALALKQQFLERAQVPMLDHDWKMDMIITPDEIIPAPQGGYREP